jgi:hypothetical protein
MTGKQKQPKPKILSRKIYVERGIANAFINGNSDDIFVTPKALIENEGYGDTDETFEIVEFTVTGVKRYRAEYTIEEVEDLETPKPTVVTPEIIEVVSKSKNTKTRKVRL